jgi:hypothetical protein
MYVNVQEMFRKQQEIYILIFPDGLENYGRNVENYEKKSLRTTCFAS